MPFVCQAVPDGNPGVFRKGFHDFLPVAPVFYAVVQSPQNPCGVGDGFLFPHLAGGRVKVGDVHTQIICRHLKGTAGAGGGFFENQHNVLPPVDVVGEFSLFLCLEVGG